MTDLITVEKNEAKVLPVLITVPHAGVFVPQEIRQAMLRTGESEASLERRLLDGCDPFTDRIYAWPEARARVLTSVSRFVVDVNRSRHATGPNGVIKKNDFDLKPFYPRDHAITEVERENRLAAYWDPFYAAIDSCLREYPFALLIDGHSMSEFGPEMGPDAGASRPAICLGVSVEDDGEGDGKTGQSNRPTCPAAVVKAAAEAAEIEVARLFPAWPANLRVGIDQPFDGGHILKHCTSPKHENALPCIMVECNRGIYLDEKSLTPQADGIARLAVVTQAIARAALAALSTTASAGSSKI